MDYFWKEHKTYLIAVAAGLIVVFAYNSCVLGPIKAGDEEAARLLRSEQDALKARMALGVPTEETIQAASNDLERSRDTLKSLTGDMAFKEGERFAPAGSEGYRSHYDDLKIKLYNELRDKAVDQRVPYPPNFGLDGAGDAVSEDLARELLSRLAVVDRLTRAALEAGVDKIEVLDALYAADPKDQPVTRKGAFLSRLSVFMKFEGTAESGFKILHGVQKKGHYLAVTGFESLKKDATKDLFAFSIAVSILKIDDKAPIEPKEEKTER